MKKLYICILNTKLITFLQKNKSLTIFLLILKHHNSNQHYECAKIQIPNAFQAKCWINLKLKPPENQHRDHHLEMVTKQCPLNILPNNTFPKTCTWKCKLCCYDNHNWVGDVNWIYIIGSNHDRRHYSTQILLPQKQTHKSSPLCQVVVRAGRSILIASWTWWQVDVCSGGPKIVCACELLWRRVLWTLRV